MQLVTEFFYEWMFSVTSREGISMLLAALFAGIVLIVSAFVLFLIVRKVLFSIAYRIAKKTETEWDDIILKNKTLNGLAHLIPATLIFFSANYAGLYFPSSVIYVRKFAEIYYLFTFIFTINAFLTSINEIYNRSFSFSKERPITGIVQLLKIFIFFAGFLFLISILFNKELSKLLTGLGAAAAILLLVFKDAILGFVASMQISMNDMLKLGDWIEMPSRNADGEVMEINLTTVKVRNWDLTISMIPTYSLISETFVNWKGMQESEGRRIKRSVNIDMTSIVFCNELMLDKFSGYSLIGEYVLGVIDQQKNNNDLKNKVTNLTIFRKYVEMYILGNPKVNKDMTLIVRHLQSNNYGLPIEIIMFSKDKVWENYESLQSDIFDHIMAVIPEFELRIYQSPMTAYLPR